MKEQDGQPPPRDRHDVGSVGEDRMSKADLKAILLDLDNTLILYDEFTFFRSYIPRITESFEDIIPPDIFPEKLISAIQALMNNDGSVSNLELFMNAFSADFEEYRDALWDRFMNFYSREFDQFRTMISVPDGIQGVFDILKEKEVKLVIASNPIWPLDAQIKRFSWTGVEGIDFDFVTHIENMSYCKPSIEYYQEICREINEIPEGCLMVGNDIVNDMIAAKIGMKTFLIVDGIEIDNSSVAVSQRLRNSVIEDIPSPDFKGKFSKLPEIVDALIMG